MSIKPKPLVRWTAGPVKSKFDDSILKRSVSNFKAIYGDRFDYLLCFNNRDDGEFKSMRIETLRQSHVEGLPEPEGCAWKLYPPRLRPESHEIFIDHDIVLVEQLPQIDHFISQIDSFLYSESSCGNRNYGRFEGLVCDGFQMNSGIFGLPPGFQFNFSLVGEWKNYFDDQGFVAASICHKGNLVRIGTEDLLICESEGELMRAKAYHFVHDMRDESWLRFLRMTTI